MTAFTLPQIGRMVGVAYPTLHRWSGEWGVAPSVRPARTGIDGIYSRRDAFAIVVAVGLKRGGACHESIQKAIRLATRAAIERRLAAGQRYLVASGDGRLLLARADAVFSEPLESVVVLDLQLVFQKFKSAVESGAWETESRRVPVEA